MSGAKGGLWERNVLDWARKQGLEAERLRLAGREDEGDIVIKDGMIHILECKDVARWNVKEWFRQAQLERDHYAKHRGLDPAAIMPLVVVKNRGTATGKGWVITSLEEYWA